VARRLLEPLGALRIPPDRDLDVAEWESQRREKLIEQREYRRCLDEEIKRAERDGDLHLAQQLRECLAVAERNEMRWLAELKLTVH
jgi:hypothetical protein